MTALGFSVTKPVMHDAHCTTSPDRKRRRTEHTLGVKFLLKEKGLEYAKLTGSVKPCILLPELLFIMYR